MEFAGEHLFPGAVLAGDQDVGVGGGDFLDHGAEPFHGGGGAPEHGVLGGAVGGEGAFDVAELFGFGAGTAQGEGVTEGGDEFGVVPRFHDEVGGAALHGFHGEVDVGVGGEEDDFDVGGGFLDFR